MSNNKKGTLIIAGSGIASIRHIRLETLSHIERADKIYYVVADPATEAFIQDKSKGDCTDLYIYYDKNKIRYDTYVQMSEVMLNAVRAGYNVLGIFYGHPGVFVSPSHRAIAIARAEGYHATMLAGVSAEDYMFSDLGFDPAFPGCMTQEASRILIHNKRLDTTVHNIIWQVGSVGVNTMEFDNRQFHLLVDHLEEDFGPKHKVIHYIGAVLPQSATIKDEFTIADLRKKNVVQKITPVSTFYLPPCKTAPAPIDLVQKVGIKILDPPPRIRSIDPTSIATTPLSLYGPYERMVVSDLQNHVILPECQVLHGTQAICEFMTDLALNPDFLERYKADPISVVDSFQGLSAVEKSALRLGEPDPAYWVMRRFRGSKKSLFEEGPRKKEHGCHHYTHTISCVEDL